MSKLNLDKAPNSKLIKDIQLKSMQSANAITTIDLDISLIDENPDNKKIFNMEDIERLANCIKTDGFFGAIEVYQKENGRYEISAGHRRCSAVRSLGWKTIPAVVSPMPEKDIQKRRKLIASNINNREMTPLDTARAIRYHLETLAMEEELSGESLGDKYVLCGQYFGMTKMQTIRYDRINQLIPQLQAMIRDGEVSMTELTVGAVPADEIQLLIYNKLRSVLESLADEPENDKKRISGVRVRSIINEVEKEEERRKELEGIEESKRTRVVVEPPRDYLAQEKREQPVTIKVEEPTDVEVAINTPSAMERIIPVYSGKNSEEVKRILGEWENGTSVKSESGIDDDLDRLAGELETLLLRKTEINNRVYVENTVKRFEELIEMIKSRI